MIHKPVLMVISILLSLIIGYNSASAQDSTTTSNVDPGKNIIAIYPLGMFNKFRGRFEYVVGKHMSVGNILTYYHPLLPDDFDVPGLKTEPFIRYYFSKGAPTGAYISPNVGIGYFYGDPDWLTGQQDYFFGYGGALSVGYQGTIGVKKRFVFDLSAGLQVFIGDPYASFDGYYWYLAGPGAILNSKFSIGYRFKGADLR